VLLVGGERGLRVLGAARAGAGEDWVDAGTAGAELRLGVEDEVAGHWVLVPPGRSTVGTLGGHEFFPGAADGVAMLAEGVRGLLQRAVLVEEPV
jgi:hypothetical protein